MVVSEDPELAARVRRLRAHGLTSATWERHRGYAEGYDVVEVGHNYRMDEIRASLGLSRLPRLAASIDLRREHVRRYRARLASTPGIELAWDDAAVAAGSHFAFPVLVEDRARRDELRVGLREHGVQTTFYPSLSQFTAYGDARGTVPRAEDIAS